MSIGIIEELGKVGVEPPSNQLDVPAVVEKLKDQLDKWKKDQDKQTKQVSTSTSFLLKSLDADTCPERRESAEGD